MFDDVVVISILSFGRQPKKVVGQNTASGGDEDASLKMRRRRIDGRRVKEIKKR